jgi:hypothetical protein
VLALTRPAHLAESLYYAKDSPVQFTLELSGVLDSDLGRVGEAHRSKIADLLLDGVLIFG